jgi:ribose transport system ATP-binding protein
MSETRLLLKLQSITKQFVGVKALDQVDLEVVAGEVHGIAGENGAGKSTLMKMLTGAYRPDAGKISFEGVEQKDLTPKRAIELGIACIYQELNLIPHLTVTENIFLGREKFALEAARMLDRKAMHDEVTTLLKDLGLNIRADSKVGALGVGQQQMVEICKAVRSNAKLIIMDEPTSSLSEKETADLYRIIAHVKKQGVTILFISHRLEEVRFLCDRVTVLRDGKSVACITMADSSVDEIIRLMVGRDIRNKYPKVRAERRGEVLSVKGLSRRGVLSNISFNLHGGEVLGFAGLVGAGRTETFRAITGADPKDTGVVKVFGKEVDIRSPRDSIREGIAFLTEDRKSQGLILIQSIAFNTTMVKMDQYAKHTVLDLGRIAETTKKMVADLQIRAAGINIPVGKLSGGNQQKVVIAKWLLSQAKIFVFDEPTRGIDVGAKLEVYKLINHLVAQGAGVVIICSEMDEVMGMADRIIVMHEGTITGEFTQEEATREKIMYAASGLDADAHAPAA